MTQFIASRRRHQPRFSARLTTVGILIALILVTLGAVQAIYWIALAGREPINILVLGLDRRPHETGPCRSDVMMLARLDSRDHTVSLLSIPRDLYVWIPGHGEGRINTAHFWGEFERPDNGPALARQAIHQNLGVPVHGYVRLDFQGLVKLVDALGGISVEVPAEIRDDRYPTDDLGYTSIVIPAGQQKMDGERVLTYVRTRHAASDFDRVRRHQQVVVALLRRAGSPAGWAHLPATLKAVREGVDTDLSLGEILLWGTFAVRSDLDAVDRIVLNETMTSPQTTDNGSQVLVPDWNRILPLMHRFGGG